MMGLIPGRDRDFSLHHHVQTCSGAHPASYPMGTGGSYTRVNVAKHEADQSPLSSAEVKNTCSYTSTSLYIFMVWCLVKHKDNFTLKS
jgi:hypothetical protein